MESPAIFAKQDFSTAFLSLYEEMKRRFREKGMYATIQTLEKCQAMLLVFLEKGRPIRPYELVDALLLNPAFSKCKDARRMVFYIMEKLLKIGLIEKVDINGKDGYYRIVKNCFEIKMSRPDEIPQITEPRVIPLITGWKKVFELRNILKLWGLPSLSHAIVYEISSLLNYIDFLKGQSNDEVEARLESVEDNLRMLMEEYIAFGKTGELSEKEVGLFHKCEEEIRKFTKRI